MKRWMLLLMMLGLVSSAAVFNRINTVINTPAAWQGVIGQFEMGGSWAPYYLLGQPYWEDDYFLNYTVTDFLQLGVTRLNGNDLAGNVQLLIGKDVFFPNMNLAFGIDNIIAKDKASTFDNLSEAYANNMSMYMVMTCRVGQWEWSAGYGEGRLANFYNAYNILMSNLFYSASYYFSKGGKNSGRFSFEYDSRDYNMALFFPITDQLDLKFALTQLPLRSGNNPNYGSVPVENFSVGVSYKMNLFSFYGEEYTKFSTKLKEISDKSNIIGEKYQSAIANADKTQRVVSELTAQKTKLTDELSLLIRDLKKEKDDLKNEMKALRDMIQSEGFKNVQVLKEDIMLHYYTALRFYYDEKYFDAIEELTKAKMINSNIPEIHIRLGSIYWTLGLKNEALDSWRTAYGLDKNNEVLNTFLKENHINFEKTEDAK